MYFSNSAIGQCFSIITPKAIIAKLQNGKIINIYLSQYASNFFFITYLFKFVCVPVYRYGTITFVCAYVFHLVSEQCTCRVALRQRVKCPLLPIHPYVARSWCWLVTYEIVFLSLSFCTTKVQKFIGKSKFFMLNVDIRKIRNKLIYSTL